MPGISSLFNRSRGAIFLSALVMPGLGQLMIQKRYLAGLFYFVVCTASALLFFFCAVWLLVVFYGLPGYQGSQEPPHPSWQLILGLFLMALFCWGMNVVDTWLGNRRMNRQQNPPPVP